MSSLPRNFPKDLLAETDYGKVAWFYQRYVEEYYKEYGFGHFILAAYAAIPALLTPDLLYKIWLNFNQYKWGKKTQSIHRIAVSDILLSPLCREVGYELYEMHHDIRTAFTAWLEATSKSEKWIDRQLRTPKIIASFLVEYHHKQNPGALRYGKGYEEVQEWNAWLYIDPDRAQQMLWQKLEKSKAQNDPTNTLRVMDFWSKSNQQVEVLFRKKEERHAFQNFNENAVFAQAFKSLIQQNNDAFLSTIQNNPALKDFLNDDPEGGMPVVVTKEITEQINQVAPTTIYAALVGINKYEGDISPLAGCVSDVLKLRPVIEQYAEDNNLELDLKILTDEEATIQNFRNLQQLFQQARNGDILFLYFAGHSEYKDLKDGNGRHLIFHDSSKAKESALEVIAQKELEDWITPVLMNKKVHCLCIFDTHEADKVSKKNLLKNQLRKNAAALKGSLVILNAGMPGEEVYEQKIQGEQTGIFSNNLITLLQEGGMSNSYEQLIRQIRLRIQQRGTEQLPFLEAFPPFASQNTFLSNQPNPETIYKLEYTGEGSWQINMGSSHGLTESLDFMRTEFITKDGRVLDVANVLSDHAVVFSVELDINKTHDVLLHQKAFPKVKIAFDPQLDERMRIGLEEEIRIRNLFYIDMVEIESEAKYFIRNREYEYFLSHNSSKYEHDFIPLFKFEENPFELIKQMEYIAHWTAILEYQEQHPPYLSDLEIIIEIYEGIVLTEDEINKTKPTQKITAENASMIPLHYQQVNGNSRQPAIRAKVKNWDDHYPYINIILLEDNYGVTYLYSEKLEPKSPPARALGPQNEQYVHFENFGGILPFTIPPEVLESGKTRSTDYLKFFFSDKPLDLSPLIQNGLEFSSQQTFRGASEGVRKETFRISGIDWKGITIGFKTIWEEEKTTSSEIVTDISSLKSYLRKLIVEDRSDLIALLKEIVVNDSKISQAVLRNSARFNSLQREINLGLISHDEATIERNKITQAFLSLINKLEEDDLVEGVYDLINQKTTLQAEKPLESTPPPEPEIIIHPDNIYLVDRQAQMNVVDNRLNQSGSRQLTFKINHFFIYGKFADAPGSFTKLLKHVINKDRYSKRNVETIVFKEIIYDSNFEFDALRVNLHNQLIQAFNISLESEETSYDRILQEQSLPFLLENSPELSTLTPEDFILVNIIISDYDMDLKLFAPLMQWFTYDFCNSERLSPEMPNFIFCFAYDMETFPKEMEGYQSTHDIDTILKELSNIDQLIILPELTPVTRRDLMDWFMRFEKELHTFGSPEENMYRLFSEEKDEFSMREVLEKLRGFVEEVNNQKK